MKKLSELVNSAIDDAKAKIASAVDVAPKSGTKIASAAAPVPSVPSKIAHKPGDDCEDDKDKKKGEKTAALVNAESAVKFAENLESLVTLFPKIAAMAGSPETFVSPSKGTTQDSNTKATSIPANMATTGGDSGKGRDVETNKHEAPYAAKAASAILDAKLAQSSALLAAGRAQEAEKLATAAKAEFELAKKAYEEEDASTKTPKGNPKTLETFVSGTTGAPGGVAPDNAGAASFTKRDGKKREIAPLSQHIKEPAFSAKTDKGLSDNLDHTEGAKIAVASIIQGAKTRKVSATAAS